MGTVRLVIAFVSAALLSCTVVRARDGMPRDLCDVLREIETGEESDVIVSGMYVEGPETRVLYSADCGGRFQPATWVELSAPTIDVEHLRSVLANFGQAHVILRGTLYGPKQAANLGGTPAGIAEASQVSQRRYGHLNLFRTQLVVHEIVNVEGSKTTGGPQLVERDQAPRLVRAELPLYPPAARAADVSGEVRLELQVRDGVVASVRSLSGHVLLARTARESVRTWAFSKGESFKATVVFDYRLVDDENVEAGTLQIKTDLPARVTITESRSKW
jgi:hypothetical protein